MTLQVCSSMNSNKAIIPNNSYLMLRVFWSITWNKTQTIFLKDESIIR